MHKDSAARCATVARARVCAEAASALPSSSHPPPLANKPPTIERLRFCGRAASRVRQPKNSWGRVLNTPSHSEITKSLSRGSTNAGLADVLGRHSSDEVGTTDFRGADGKRRKIVREKGRVLQKSSFAWTQAYNVHKSVFFGSHYSIIKSRSVCFSCQFSLQSHKLATSYKRNTGKGISCLNFRAFFHCGEVLFLCTVLHIF